MAASSVGHRSCAGQKEMAALKIKAAAFIGVLKGCFTTAFFFCRRAADNQFILF